MSLSFEDSLKKSMVSDETVESDVAVTTMMDAYTNNDVEAEDENYSVMAMSLNRSYAVETYSDNSENWQEHDGYDHYSVFSDNDISTINETKDISLNRKQLSITQEVNSQYVPFEMPRYYDGFDLKDTDIYIHYVTSKKNHNATKAINVKYNDGNGDKSKAKIRFGWLIDGGATIDAGALKFEIHATGSFSDNNGNLVGYIWKSKSDSNLVVLQSICPEDEITNEINDSWIEKVVTEVAEGVADKIANIEIGGQVEAAEKAAGAAMESASEAQQYAKNASTAVTNAVNAIIDDYATKDYVAEAIEEEDITGKLTDYAKLSDLGTLVDDEGNVLTVEEYVAQEVEAIDVSEKIGDLGADNDGNPIATVVDYVNKRVDEVDVSEQLANYYTKDEVDEVLENVDLDGYATEKFVTDRTDALKTSVDANKSSIDALGSVVKNIDDVIKGIDKSPNLHYRATYGTIELEDGSQKDNMFVLWQAEEPFDPTDENDSAEKTAVSRFEIVGGGGGGATSNKLYIYYDTDESGKDIKRYAFRTEDVAKKEAVIKYSFYGEDPVGSGVDYANAVWQIRRGTSGAWTTISTETIYSYDDKKNEFNISDHILSVGTYQLMLSVSDNSGGYMQKTWTVQNVEFKIELRFDDTIKHSGTVKIDYTPYGVDIDKDLHFKLYNIANEEEVVIDSGIISIGTSSNIQNPEQFVLPRQEHGSYLLEVYMTGKIMENTVTSNIITKDIIWFDDTNDTPVIGSIYQNFTAKQYETTNIVYTVYDINTETPTVEIAVDGVIVSTPTLADSNTTEYAFKTDKVGKHIITITCGETTKTLVANIEKLDINVKPVETNLVFDFNPVGKSNNSESDKSWHYETDNNNVSMIVSDNFDWVNGGYQYDENEDQYFCIKAGTSAEIDYKLFADDAKKNGKEFKLVFKTANVAKTNATFLNCVDAVSGYYYNGDFYSDYNYQTVLDAVSGSYYCDINSKRYYIYSTEEINGEIVGEFIETDSVVGIRMDVHEASVYGQIGKLNLSYSEEDIIEFEFNISKDTETIPMVMGYEDGVSTRPMIYDSSYNFTQNTPRTISLGSDYCDLHIYRFKVYNSSLSDSEILDNFIADARNIDEMVSRYNRNQIYDNGILDPDILAEKCPWLRIIKIEAPYFTNDKDEKIGGTTIQHIYKNGLRPSDNWTATDAAHSGQGTSSNNYGAAGRNLDLIIRRVKDKKTGVYVNENPIFTLNDGSTTNKVSLTENSVPVDYFNVKVNIASSNNLTNPLLAKRYNDFNPYDRPFVRPIEIEDRYTTDEISAMSAEEKAAIVSALKAEEQVEIGKIKDTMEFYNCVVFVRETDTTQDSNGNYINHREFNNTNYNFYALGNIGDSKKTDDTRLTDMDDEYECCIEIMDVRRELSDFPVNTIVNAMRYEEDDNHNKEYFWAKDENLDILYELIDGEYVLTKDTTVDLTKTYYVDALEHDDFSEDFTYGWRYISDKDNENIVNYCHQKWIEAYRFVVRDLTTNGELDEEKVKIWKSEFENYFVLNSILYYYLFTTRYCMVDNRAKNLFFHYGKTNDVDSDGNPIRKFDLSWDYDNDTSLGLNNYGTMVYSYGLEDIDVDENGTEVFRESDSTFFCRIRDFFADELEALYQILETNNAWKASAFIEQCDEWQSQFPEELWRLDIERKYIRTYTSSFINGAGDEGFLRTMANGKMKYHRRQWERCQEQYMASKYKTTTASSDNNSIILRCQTPSGDLAVPVNYSLKLRAYDTIYLNVQYGTGNNPSHIRVTPNRLSEDIEIFYSGETDIIKIYSAPFIQSLGDISACYPYTVSVKNANKLKELTIGNDTVGYNNTYFSSLELGSNPLLEKINVENVSGLGSEGSETKSLDLSLLNNLKELYAHGTNINGVIFADGGRIEIAELPAVTSIIMKNLAYLTNLDITNLNKLTALTVENCNTVDLVSILNRANNINRIRLINVDWTLENDSSDGKEIPLLNKLYKLKGLDKNNYNIEQPVLTGNVYVLVIRQQRYQEYKDMWPDLQITYSDSGFVVQYPVTFVNADDTPLLDSNGKPMVQYVDVNQFAIDPSIYDENGNPIFPTIENDIDYAYTFAKKWVLKSTGDVFDFKTPIRQPLTLKAVYDRSLRTYGIKYVTKTKTVEDSGLYGRNVEYNYEEHGIPYFNGEEDANTFYLFSHWDKSGFLLEGENGTDLENEVKVVNAVYDKFTYDESTDGLIEQNENPDVNGSYTIGNFKGLELKDLSPVHVHALTRLGVDNTPMGQFEDGSYVGLREGDPYTIAVGNDVDYSDIDSNLLISEKTSFGNDNYTDTTYQLFNMDKDFVLAIDYKFLGQKSGTLLQCLDAYGNGRGFKLWYNGSNVLFTYDGVDEIITKANKREMIVIRNEKDEGTGEYILSVYNSNLDNNEIKIVKLNRSVVADTDASLIFGGSYSYGEYGNFVDADINWAKIWFKDLGDYTCQSLAMWTHESIDLNVCGFKRYILTDKTKSSFSLLASHLLERTKQWNNGSNSNNNGGWTESDLNKLLNNRLYKAIPIQIRYLLKPMIVWGNDGIGSSKPYYTNVTSSDCYITIPAIVELCSKDNANNYQTLSPYKDEIQNGEDDVSKKTISYMSNNDARIRTFKDGSANIYWTRSPDVNYDNYIWCINESGSTKTITGTQAYNSHGVLIEISF